MFERTRYYPLTRHLVSQHQRNRGSGDGVVHCQCATTGAVGVNGCDRGRSRRRSRSFWLGRLRLGSEAVPLERCGRRSRYGWHTGRNRRYFSHDGRHIGRDHRHVGRDDRNLSRNHRDLGRWVRRSRLGRIVTSGVACCAMTFGTKSSPISTVITSHVLTCDMYFFMFQFPHS